MDPRYALIYNLLSALTFPLGGLIADSLAGRVAVAVLMPSAAGNLIYIAVADLLPEFTTSPIPMEKVLHSACFGLGLLTLLGIAVAA